MKGVYGMPKQENEQLLTFTSLNAIKILIINIL